MATASNYLIPGTMPFGQGGNPYQGGGIGNLGSAYQQSYQAALDQNKALYSNILGGYQQTMANQVGAQANIAGGYGQLYNNVLGGISNIGASQGQAIEDVYAQQKGQAQQSLTSRGLGNTTVSDSVQRGLGLDKSKAQIALANQMAQTTAGYQSQLGLAGLGYGNMANMQNTGQANQQLGWMNSVQAQYPNAQSYNQLAQMSGQAQQANADRAAIQKLGQRGGSVATGGSGGSGFRQSTGSSLPFGLYSHGGAGGGYTGMYGGGGSFIDATHGEGKTTYLDQGDQFPQWAAPDQSFDPTYDTQYDTSQMTMPGDYYGGYGEATDFGDYGY